MVLRLGSATNPNNLYVGSDAVTKIYKGTEQVWPSAVPSVGTVTIAKTTQPVITAPAPVWLEVDSISGLIASDGPTGGAYYDPSFHHITYIWQVRGAPLAPFAAPSNMRSEWNDPNVQWGKKVAFSFPAAGTYDIDLVAIDAAGNTATASEQVTVVDTDATYNGTDTVVIALDGNFTGAPAGAQQVTTLAAISPLLDAAASPIRLLFKRGEDYTDVAIQADSNTRLTHVGAWGAGARPILRPEFKTNTGPLGWVQNHQESQITVTDLDFLGAWDPLAELGEPAPSAIDFKQVGISNVVFSLHNLRANGFATCFNIYLGYAPTFYSGQRVMLSDCESTNWSSYALFIQEADRDQHVAALGCKFAMNPDALNGGGSKNILYNLHGPIRVSKCDNLYIAQCDLYSRTGWSTGGTANYADQPCLRLDTRGVLGQTTIVNRCVMEGGFQVIDMDGEDSSAPDNPGNNLIENNLLFSTSALFDSLVVNGRAAATFRNNIGVLLNVIRQTGGSAAQRAMFSHVADNEANSVTDEPIFIYNNTLYNSQSSANDGNRTWVLSDNQTTWNTVTVENNILHFPDGDNPVTTQAPINVASTFSNITPRHKGVRYGFDYYDGLIPGGTLSNGASMNVPYTDIRDGLVTARVGGPAGSPTSQAYWQAVPGTDNRHMIRLGNGSYYHAAGGEFTISYADPVNIVITNTSGEDWVNASFRMKLDRTSLIPVMDTSFASPATVPVPQPAVGSPALDGATTGLVAYLDFDGDERTGTPDQGAIEV